MSEILFFKLKTQHYAEEVGGFENADRTAILDCETPLEALRGKK